MKMRPVTLHALPLLLLARTLQAAPDLVVESFDPVRQTIVVRNVGSSDAMFAERALLVSNSEEWVPVGGRIAPSQAITAKASSGVAEAFDPCIYTTPPPAPPPINASGRIEFRVDPANQVIESSESNNQLLVRVPQVNPASRDLTIGWPRAWVDGAALRFEFTVRNSGLSDVRLCSRSGPSQPIDKAVYSANIDGKPEPVDTTVISSPWIFEPRSERKVSDAVAIATPNQYGVVDSGLAPGCHRIHLRLDPQNLLGESDETNNAATIHAATGGATCGVDQRPDWCTYLAPEPMRMSNIFFGDPARPGPNRNCGGLIGVMQNCSGGVAFNNFNLGTKRGFLEVPFSVTASRSGIAEVTFHDTAGRFTGRWSITGDHLYSAPGGKPDSALKITTTVRVLADTRPTSLPTTVLLDQQTFGNGMGNDPYSRSFTVPAKALVSARVGEKIQYIVRLDVDSYSSDKGLVGMNISRYGVLSNDWDRAGKACF